MPCRIGEEQQEIHCENLNSVITSPVHQQSHAINPYHVLNVRSDASLNEIQTAYRKLALLHHPCRNSSGSSINEDKAFLFAIINASYETLIVPETRQRYDTLIANGTERKFETPPRHSCLINHAQLQERDYCSGPFTDMYQARQHTPFRNPYEQFDDVFQCKLFSTATKPPPSQLTVVVSTPSFTPTSDIPKANKEENDFFYHFSSHIIQNLCYCAAAFDAKGCTTENADNGDKEEIPAMMILHPPATTSTYLFCPDYYKCRKWIGTSITSPDKTRHTCQISKINPDNQNCITKTEITTRATDGTFQTEISVCSSEPYQPNFLLADSSTYRETLSSNQSSDTMKDQKSRRRRRRKKNIRIDQKPSLLTLLWKSHSLYPYCSSCCHS